MDNLLVNKSTLANIMQFITGSHHAIALVGPIGAGKTVLARDIAGQLLGTAHITPDRLKIVMPENGTITIDSIRELRSFLRLKIHGESSINRVIIVEDAHAMAAEAQNALLKILEEPPGDTRLILTVNNLNNLLPTINSRLQHVIVRACTLEHVLSFFGTKGYSEINIKKAYALSGGYAGLCNALLATDSHPLKEAVDKAKILLKSPAYDRILMVDELVKDKAKLNHLLFALKRVLTVSLEQTARSRSGNIRRTLNGLKLINQTEVTIGYNANAKLALTNLFLNL